MERPVGRCGQAEDEAVLGNGHRHGGRWFQRAKGLDDYRLVSWYYAVKLAYRALDLARFDESCFALLDRMLIVGLDPPQLQGVAKTTAPKEEQYD
jgi:hypothetical protein